MFINRVSLQRWLFEIRLRKNPCFPLHLFLTSFHNFVQAAVSLLNKSHFFPKENAASVDF